MGSAGYSFCWNQQFELFKNKYSRHNASSKSVIHSLQNPKNTLHSNSKWTWITEVFAMFVMFAAFCCFTPFTIMCNTFYYALRSTRKYSPVGGWETFLALFFWNIFQEDFTWYQIVRICFEWPKISIMVSFASMENWKFRGKCRP